MVDASSYEVSLTQYVSTEAPQQVIEHFICKICNNIVFQPKECPNCEQVYCFDCSISLTAHQKKWKCQKCQSDTGLQDMHRVIKEVLDQVVFKCYKCSSKRSYSDMIKHLKECGEGAGGGGFSMENVQAERKISLVAPKQEVSLSIVSMKGLDIYIMEKDSKKFYIYNTLDQGVQTKTIATTTNFPHNFQAIQVGVMETKVFIVGGGDFNALPETMFQMNQIVPTQDGYKYEAREKMKYARHGHSCCSMGENLIFVTGSRKDVGKAQFRTEVFNTEENKWYELGMLVQGRHYHSSCSFGNSAIYIFCGISNETKKYLNTIEKLQFNAQNIIESQKFKWELLTVSDSVLLAPRQGQGVCQVNQDEILIVGGFHGKFSNETFFFNTKYNKIRKAYNELKDNIFPFQVPTVADPSGKSVYTVDWQTYKLYEFKNDKWEFKKKIRP